MRNRMIHPVLLTVFLAFSLCCNCSKNQDTPAAEATSKPGPEIAAPVPEPSSEPEKSSPVEVINSFGHLDSLIKNTADDLLIFDLYADWCRPCKILAPVYTSLARKHGSKARFFRIDIQKHRDIASAFRVNGIPLVVFMKDKEIIHAVTGVRPAEHYESVITSCGSSVSKEECVMKLKNSL